MLDQERDERPVEFGKQMNDRNCRYLMQCIMMNGGI